MSSSVSARGGTGGRARKSSSKSEEIEVVVEKKVKKDHDDDEDDRDNVRLRATDSIEAAVRQLALDSALHIDDEDDRRNSNGSSKPLDEAVETFAETLTSGIFRGLLGANVSHKIVKTLITKLQGHIVSAGYAYSPPVFQVTPARLCDGHVRNLSRILPQRLQGANETTAPDILAKSLFGHIVSLVRSSRVAVAIDAKHAGDDTANTDAALCVFANAGAADDARRAAESCIKSVDDGTIDSARTPRTARAARTASTTQVLGNIDHLFTVECKTATPSKQSRGSYVVQFGTKTIRSSDAYLIVMWKKDAPASKAFTSSTTFLRAVRRIVFVTQTELVKVWSVSASKVTLHVNKMTTAGVTEREGRKKGRPVSIRVVTGGREECTEATAADGDDDGDEDDDDHNSDDTVDGDDDDNDDDGDHYTDENVLRQVGERICEWAVRTAAVAAVMAESASSNGSSRRTGTTSK